MLTMIMVGAAAGDPDLRELSETAEVERLHGVQNVVEALARRGDLRGGLDLDEATDIAWVFISPEMWRLLT